MHSQYEQSYQGGAGDHGFFSQTRLVTLLASAKGGHQRQKGSILPQTDKKSFETISFDKCFHCGI